MGQELNAERAGMAEDPDGVPDLLDLDLETLRELDHPVLSEVLEGLRTRLGEPSETLWAFNSAF